MIMVVTYRLIDTLHEPVEEPVIDELGQRVTCGTRLFRAHSTLDGGLTGNFEHAGGDGLAEGLLIDMEQRGGGGQTLRIFHGTFAVSAALEGDVTNMKHTGSAFEHLRHKIYTYMYMCHNGHQGHYQGLSWIYGFVLDLVLFLLREAEDLHALDHVVELVHVVHPVHSVLARLVKVMERIGLRQPSIRVII